MQMLGLESTKFIEQASTLVFQVKVDIAVLIEGWKLRICVLQAAGRISSLEISVFSLKAFN